MKLNRKANDGAMCAARHTNLLTPSSSSSSATTPSTSTPAVKRACDACHRRKVKCPGDGTRACRSCVVAGLKCTYNTVPQKKGPRGSKAKVISELRQTQLQTQQPALEGPANPQPNEPKQSKLVSNKLILACTDFYFANIHPTAPILLRQKVGETIGRMSIDDEACCVVYSLCGYMMIQPNLHLPPEALEHLDFVPQSHAHLGQLLLDEAIRARQRIDHVESPSAQLIVTSYFLFGSYFSLGKHKLAWFHLREATTLALSLGMHDESTYESIPDIAERCRLRRLYWLLFLTERAYALQQHKPLSLYRTILLPSTENDPSETTELNGFVHLVNLFQHFDDEFVGLWNKSRTKWTTEELELLQQGLAGALPTNLDSTENQAADLRCSQHWLRTIVWQLSWRLSIDQGIPFSVAAEGAMSLNFPIDVARDLVSAAARSRREAMEVHGIGLVEKLFDVAYLLTDVMACVRSSNVAASTDAATSSVAIPTASSSSLSATPRASRAGSFATIGTQSNLQFGPADFLDQLLKLIGTLRGGQQRFMPILLSKINGMPGGSTLGHSFPILPSALPLLPDVPSSSTAAAASSADVSVGAIDLAMTAPATISAGNVSEYPAFEYPTCENQYWGVSNSVSSGSTSGSSRRASDDFSMAASDPMRHGEEEGSHLYPGPLCLGSIAEDFTAEQELDDMDYGDVNTGLPEEFQLQCHFHNQRMDSVCQRQQRQLRFGAGRGANTTTPPPSEHLAAFEFPLASDLNDSTDNTAVYRPNYGPRD